MKLDASEGTFSLNIAPALLWKPTRSWPALQLTKSTIPRRIAAPSTASSGALPLMFMLLIVR